MTNPTRNSSILIFSFDRAMQLDGMLRSFFLHCTDHDQASITVLFKASNERYLNQYLDLAKEYTTVQFAQQNNFREDVINWISTNSSVSWVRKYKNFTSFYLRSQKNKLLRKVFNRYVRKFWLKMLPYDEFPYLLFLVDDNIFVRKFSIKTAVDHLKSQPNALGFSLRLGKNTTYCYPHRSNQTLPEFSDNGDQVLMFNWVKADQDFHYPLEVSSSIYRSKQLLPLLLGTSFENPNSLEGGIASQTKLFEDNFPFLLSFEKSVTFCNPINVVQKLLDNRSGSNNIYSAQSLSELFESGKRIEVLSFDNFIPNGCHQEVELVFVDKTL